MGHGKGLAGPGNPEQHLIPFAVLQAEGQFLDCLWLIARRFIGGLDPEGRESSFEKESGRASISKLLMPSYMPVPGLKDQS
jgi:hypothetical protein